MTIPVFVNVNKGLIRPHLEFCNQAWYPQVKKNTRLIENVQRRATRMVQGLRPYHIDKVIVSVLRAGTLSYNERLKKLEQPSLDDRRRRGAMIEMFKLQEIFAKK